MSEPCKDYMKYARNVIKNDSEKLHCEFRYICKLPCNKSHRYHDLGPTSSEKEFLDVKLLRYIKTLVSDGMTDLDDIYEAIEDFAEGKLTFKERKRNKICPGSINIMNTVNKIKIKIRNIQFEQEKDKILSSLGNWGEESEIFLRMGKTDTFLLVYQNHEMRRLFRLYGSNSILLDAVHRTCEFIWPLYFLIVNTNCGYQVAAFFIAQYETIANISEALSVIRSWNTDTLPKYFLVNRPFEDVKGIEAVYPDIQTYVSSYHRIQVWQKKLARRENSEVNQSEVFDLLQVVANSKTEEEMKSHLKLVCESLKNSRARCYFLNYWRYYVKRWVFAFWPKDLDFEVNNGITRLGDDVKYDYITQNKCKTLTQIIETLILKYIPFNLNHYRQENMTMISKLDSQLKTTICFRSFAHWVKDLIIKTHNEAAEILSENEIGKLSAHRFAITPLNNKSTSYEVLIDCDSRILSCDCPQFDRACVLCSHIVMVGLVFSEFHISNIVTKIFKDPMFHYDDFFCELLKTEPVENMEYIVMDEQLGGEEVVETENHLEITDKEENEDSLQSQCLSELKSIETMLPTLSDKKLKKLCRMLQKFKKKNFFAINVAKCKTSSIVSEESQNTSEEEEME